MKRWILLAIFAMTCASMDASILERAGTLSSKVTFDDESGYFSLGDGSFWKVIGFTPRWRTLREWWNNVQLAPEEYYAHPKDWLIGTIVEAYPKYGNLDVNESDATNQEALKQCSHLLYNTRTQQVLFAIELHPADLLIHLNQDAQKHGYNQGYAAGRNKAGVDYNQGFADGQTAANKTSVNKENDAYNRGFSDGSRVGSSSVVQREDSAYSLGYADGYKKGHAEGKTEGAANVVQREDSAYSLGYSDGYKKGYDECYKEIFPPPAYR